MLTVYSGKSFYQIVTGGNDLPEKPDSMSQDLYDMYKSCMHKAIDVIVASGVPGEERETRNNIFHREMESCLGQEIIQTCLDYFKIRDSTQVR